MEQRQRQTVFHHLMVIPLPQTVVSIHVVLLAIGIMIAGYIIAMTVMMDTITP